MKHFSEVAFILSQHLHVRVGWCLCTWPVLSPGIPCVPPNRVAWRGQTLVWTSPSTTLHGMKTKKCQQNAKYKMVKSPKILSTKCHHGRFCMCTNFPRQSKCFQNQFKSRIVFMGFTSERAMLSVWLLACVIGSQWASLCKRELNVSIR